MSFIIESGLPEFSFDAFGRQRMSAPSTQFDSKQDISNQPLMWDDQEVSGSGTSSVHSANRASSIISVSNLTAGKRVRQTFQRFNYQPGKSQLCFFTGIPGPAVAGIKKEAGAFDDLNGIFYRVDANGFNAIIRSNVTGVPVDTVINYTAFSEDPMDGSGPSKLALDPTKAQIFFVDFEWLGAGTVSFGVIVNKIPHYIHHQHHANIDVSVYMSTPNLPIRYSIENDGTGPAASLEQICCTVISEGGNDHVASLRYASTDGVPLTASSQLTVYAAIGLRLKANSLGCHIDMVDLSLLGTTNDSFEWKLIRNPAILGTFTYVDLPGTCLEVAKGVTANTVTGGDDITGGLVSKSDRIGLSSLVENSVHLGAYIDNTPTTLVLCVRPFSNGLVVHSAISFRQAA